MRPLKITLSCLLAFAVAACAMVRQQDLDAWVGAPVEALDTHSFFITVPMVRTRTDSGIEIRNFRQHHIECRALGGIITDGVEVVEEFPTAT